MKRSWDSEEIVEYFTLVSSDFDLLGNKTGATRLGFALLLKCFQVEARFPATKAEIPRAVIDYIANQLRLPASLYNQYDWTGRTVTNHRTQIRDSFSFRDATLADGEEMTAWLISTGHAASPWMEQLKETVYARFRGLHLVPPTPERIERIIHSACHSYEQTFFTDTFEQLSPSAREHLDRMLEHIGLPSNLFSAIPSKGLNVYRQRAAAETLYELRRHPDATQYTLLAAFCWQRRQEILDNLVDLLLVIIHQKMKKEDLHALSPLIYRHVNPYGEFRLI